MSNPQFAAKVKEAYLIGLEIKSLETKRKSILDEIDGVGVGEHDAGDFVLKISPTLRFNAAEAYRNLTPEQFESISVLTPNATLAKEVLGDDYAKAQKVYGQTRSIEPKEDHA